MSRPGANRFSDAAREELEKCARCGKCRAACPVFAVVKDEAFVARGRIALADALAKGEIPASEEIRTIMSACLMCRRCSEGCPSGVEFLMALNAARAYVARERGLPLIASFFFRHILPNRRLFDAVIRCASVGQKILPGRRVGALRHLPLLYKGGKWLPPLARASVLKAHANTPKVAHARMRVGIFVGCLINYVYPQIIDDTLHVLREAHIEAVIPPSQVCCGTPVLAFGDIEAARKLARRNLQSFRNIGCDYIITPCASCGRTLKHEYEQLLESAAPPLGAPALDVSEFLCEFGELTFKRTDALVTYHDPCHLRWGQDVAAEPRKLLAQSAHFVEPSGEMTCCGLGGAFHVLYPEIAESLGRKKLESLSSLNISEVATGCPGCVLQLNDLFARSRSDKKAAHTIEVLARSIGKKEMP